MRTLFLQLFNMSITAGWLAVALILLRPLLKRLQKGFLCALWGLVGLRLLLPFSVETAFSLIPSAETVPQEILYAKEPAIHSGIPALNSVLNPILGESLAPTVGNSANPMQIITQFAAILWCIGMVGMAGYACISFLRVRRKTRIKIEFEPKVYLCDGIDTPFILGVFRPRIYLPSSMDKADIPMVLAHERAHLKRKDHWWKPLGFALLTVYWFQPLLWIGYILFCRDIELACDERVIKTLGEDRKKLYSEALLHCSAPHTALTVCPLAFGEVGTKKRIKAVLSYKKPTLWLLNAAILIGAALTACFLTDPKADNDIFISISSETTCEQVDYTFKNGGTETDPFIEVQWENYTEDAVCFGNEFTVYRDGEAIVPEKLVWESNLIVINPSDSHTEQYYLSYYDLPVGRYCIEKEFYLQTKPDIQYIARVEFDVCCDLEPQKNPLTLEDVTRLAETGDALTWADFEDFDFIETGSGLYIRDYEIDERFHLTIVGINTDETPMYFYLHARNMEESSIDIRYDNVAAFIADHREDPITENLSASWHTCPIGTQEGLEAAIFSMNESKDNFSVSSIQYLPFIRIENGTEFEQFLDKTKDLMAMDRSYSDTESFRSALTEYDDAFFEENDLFLTYCAEPMTSIRHTVGYLKKSEGGLYVSLQTIDPEEGDTAFEGWLICIRIAKKDLTDVKTISCRKGSVYYPRRDISTAAVTAIYQYNGGRLVFYNNGRFSHSTSPYSSYIAMGFYDTEETRIVLRYDDSDAAVEAIKQGEDLLINDQRWRKEE